MGRLRADPDDVLSRASYSTANWLHGGSLGPFLDGVSGKFGGRLTEEIVGLHLRHIGRPRLIGVAS